MTMSLPLRYAFACDNILSKQDVLIASDNFMLSRPQEKKGSFKGDICRGAALYVHGGFYMDVDIEALYPLVGFVRPSTTFTTVTCSGAFDA